MPLVGDAAWVLQRGMPPDDAVRALAVALREGALESAGLLAEELVPALHFLSPVARRRAREHVIETLIARGERERAMSLAIDWNDYLRRTAAGVSLLEVLHRSGKPTWLPNGRANVLALAAQISCQELDGSGLTRAIAARPWTWVTQPELHLLGFSANLASRPHHAVAHLNRYLGLYGAPRLVPSDGDGQNLFGGLRWASSRPVKSGPLVSVVMAARNAVSTVRDAVRSLLAQSYRSLEVLVCDDASDDATLEALRFLQAEDPRVRLFASTRRQGTYNVRNALALHASGTLVTFHDADDIALPNRIALQVATLARSNAGACVGSCLRVSGDDRFVFFKDQGAARLAPVSLMVTRELFRACGPFRSARVGADFELYSALREKAPGGILRVRAPLLLARWSRTSMTRQRGTEALEDGYRAPARRAYSELIFAKYGARRPVSEDCWRDMLISHDNYIEPTSIVAA